MTHLVSTEVTRKRIAKWFMQAQPVENKTWTERRQAIVFGGHTYLVDNGQVFQCAHCGTYDPAWSSVEVLKYFEDLGIKPQEIEITCSFKQ